MLTASPLRSPNELDVVAHRLQAGPKLDTTSVTLNPDGTIVRHDQAASRRKLLPGKLMNPGALRKVISKIRRARKNKRTFMQKRHASIIAIVPTLESESDVYLTRLN